MGPRNGRGAGATGGPEEFSRARAGFRTLGAMSDLRDRLQASLGDAYPIERELGGGGMSRVFVAQETALGRQVVVKVLPPEWRRA